MNDIEKGTKGLGRKLNQQTAPAGRVFANPEDPQGPNMAENMKWIMILSGIGIILLLFAIFSIPDIVSSPQKYTLTLFLAGGCFFADVYLIKGREAFVATFTETKKLMFLAGYVGSIIGTLICSFGFNSYFLALIFAVLQVLTLGWLIASSVPGGLAMIGQCCAGMKNCLSGLFRRQ